MTQLPMSQLPILLPGMVPLLPLPAVPTGPAPAEDANPFLALLAELVGPAPSQQAATPEPATTPAGVDTDGEPEDGDEPDTEEPVLPVLPQLMTPPVPVVPPPVAAPRAELPTQAPDVEVEAATPVPAAPAPVVPTQPPVTSPPAVAPVVHVAAPATPAPVAAPVQAPAPVAHQVFPEVVRVAVTGETPSRVVVRLEPEHLGEVRVVLRTTRAGLEVSLAAGTEARAAIREGAPELRRMLEAAGSPDARVVVRHLVDASAPAAAPTQVAAVPSTPSSARTDAAPVPGSAVDVGAGTAGGTAHGDHRGRSWQDATPTATDGRPDRTLEPARQVRRSGGLDVMM